VFRRTIPAGLAAILAAVALAGCTTGAADTTATSAAATTTTQTTATTRSAALAYQSAIVEVVRSVSPSVVQISTTAGLGSGVVFDADGHIVTNAHVVGTARSFSVTTSSGKRLEGTLVGTFAADDLAVIHVAHAGLTPASFGDSSRLHIGDLAIAIGNPLGLRSSTTDGIVSALGRNVSEPNGATLPSVIQTSAPINPGNSGGALVDISGHVIGIPTLAATDQQLGGGAAPGIGFAIPSNLVQDIASQLIEHGHVVNSHRAYLGVQVGDAGGQGAYVGTVVAGGPAAKAGFAVGDVIVSVAGKQTPTPTALGSVLAGLEPGGSVKVTFRTQSGDQKTVQVTLGEYPGGG
jgi:putative serine protease PepD